MSKSIQTVEELDAVLHWRGKHAQAIRERDALQQLLNQRDEQVESLKMRPQGEPVARHPDAIIEGVMTSVGITHAIYASTVSLKHGEQVKLYAEQPAPVAVVPELTSELRWILGQMCFQHIHTAQALRLMGHQIARKAEDEQAVTIYWMLGHYLKDPANWRQNASAEMKAAAPKA
ncbi:hypothetical protein [Pseudomonas grimontii]|uniref:hypothetical protein n=1 Tax=Pseudomonas grimontii TaxID=129847 RepID=UPI00387B4804